LSGAGNLDSNDVHGNAVSIRQGTSGDAGRTIVIIVQAGTVAIVTATIIIVIIVDLQSADARIQNLSNPLNGSIVTDSAIHSKQHGDGLAVVIHISIVGGDQSCEAIADGVSVHPGSNHA